MFIPKQIAKKVNEAQVLHNRIDEITNELLKAVKKFKTLQGLKAEVEELDSEIVDWFLENDEANEGIDIHDFCISAEAYGENQGDGEFCLQYRSGSDYSGTYFYPIEGSTSYVAMNYECREKK